MVCDFVLRGFCLVGFVWMGACSYFLRSVLGVGSLLGFVVFLLVL